MKFNGVCLITEDVPGLERFYQRVFGAHGEGDDRHSTLVAAGLDLTLFSRAGMEDMAPGSMQAAGYGSFILGFEVQDVDREYERLLTLRVEIVKPPQTHPWGSRSVWFRDPDGNIINFYCQVD